MLSSKDETINNFEKEFKELIIEHDLQNQMIYIDLDNINKEFIDLLKKSPGIIVCDDIKNNIYPLLTHHQIRCNRCLKKSVFSKGTGHRPYNWTCAVFSH